MIYLYKSVVVAIGYLWSNCMFYSANFRFYGIVHWSCWNPLILVSTEDPFSVPMNGHVSVSSDGSRTLCQVRNNICNDQFGQQIDIKLTFGVRCIVPTGCCAHRCSQWRIGTLWWIIRCFNFSNYGRLHFRYVEGHYGVSCRCWFRIWLLNLPIPERRHWREVQ